MYYVSIVKYGFGTGWPNPNLNMLIKHEYTISQQTIDVLTKKLQIF